MRRSKIAMKYHGFYCSDELWETMQRLAAEIDESDSEFIRNAIHERIQNKPHWEQIRNRKNGPYPEVGEGVKEHKEGRKPTIPELKEKVKEMESPKMVQTFMKGGK